MADKLRVWERGQDMVLAEHLTKVGRLTTSTLETVRFERPEQIDFRLVRGPVPYVAETYRLREAPGGTCFTYSGELGADLWRLGEWWADRVAAPWEAAVGRRSMQSKSRRSAAQRPRAVRAPVEST